LDSIKRLVSAEIFSSFLEMSEYLLEEGYKDASAVMIGSVLEEQLRVLCDANSIPVTFNRNGNEIPKKSNLLNADLYKAEIYNRLDNKSITAWLDLRNSAAHGKYNEYSYEDVKFMYEGVINFISKN
jgi:hypothetical protein